MTQIFEILPLMTSMEIKTAPAPAHLKMISNIGPTTLEVLRVFCVYPPLNHH